MPITEFKIQQRNFPFWVLFVRGEERRGDGDCMVLPNCTSKDTQEQQQGGGGRWRRRGSAAASRLCCSLQKLGGVYPNPKIPNLLTSLSSEFMKQPKHSLTHSLLNSWSSPSAHSLTHSLTHSPTRLFVCLLLLRCHWMFFFCWRMRRANFLSSSRVCNLMYIFLQLGPLVFLHILDTWSNITWVCCFWEHLHAAKSIQTCHLFFPRQQCALIHSTLPGFSPDRLLGFRMHLIWANDGWVQDCLVNTDRNWKACQAGGLYIDHHPFFPFSCKHMCTVLD